VHVWIHLEPVTLFRQKILFLPSIYFPFETYISDVTFHFLHFGISQIHFDCILRAPDSFFSFSSLKLIIFNRSKDDAMVFARGLSEDPGISEMVATRSARWASSWLETWFVYWAFFWCGMGTATAWNLFLTLYPFFEHELKQEVLLFLLAAYNLPGLPVLLFQARCDAPVERRVGSKPAYLMRVSFCMVRKSGDAISQI
jgi:hypothetical protein